MTRLEDIKAKVSLRGILPGTLVTVVAVEWRGDKLEAVRTGNWFLETSLVIARLDKMARDENTQQKLLAPDGRWDLVVCDEAHKMSATVFGREIKYTKRYRLGQLLSGLTRHLLLMTATPHNGKDDDFQLFMALIDPDRFEGRLRDSSQAIDVSDLMRRMVKERLLKFDGTPLFPKRVAHTVPYKLSAEEGHLYQAVTDYVRQEFNRAEKLQQGRAGTVGFALTVLQRRLASSPEAIYQSLRRRRERLEGRMAELRTLQHEAQTAALRASFGASFELEDLEDLDDAPEDEVEAAEELILDQATAARSIVELEAEIETLKHLEGQAQKIRRGGADTKWRELASLLDEIFSPTGATGRSADSDVPPPVPSPHQKLVIFTDDHDPGMEPRMLFYLEHAIRDAGRTRGGERRVVSKRLLYVEHGADGTPRHPRYAPYLDYRPLEDGEPTPEAILARPECGWISRDLEKDVLSYAVEKVVPEHLEEVRSTPRADRQDPCRGLGAVDQRDRPLE